MSTELTVVSRAIDRLSDPSARVIYRGRYICGKTWKEVTERNAHYASTITTLTSLNACY